jgi:hypothetical protein
MPSLARWNWEAPSKNETKFSRAKTSDVDMPAVLIVTAILAAATIST